MPQERLKDSEQSFNREQALPMGTNALQAGLTLGEGIAAKLSVNIIRQDSMILVTIRE